jgi:asparagine synthase (glutamine-hydrolysing)
LEAIEVQMCGIVVVANLVGSVDYPRFAEALNSLAHRGPDGEGTEFIALQGVDRVALGHRRLSIFDLSDAGRQPMSDARGRKITYNGEIFNWPELRQELRQLGHSFATQTDTEVILAAYDQWGADCVKRFNGFWALAIFDPGTAGGQPNLFLSRDHFGIKPLYYAIRDKGIVLASEIRAILTYLGERPSPDMEQLARELVLHTGEDSERTIYSGIMELEPAHSAVYEIATGQLRCWRFWQPDPANKFEGSEAEALDQFAYLLEDSVRIRLRADREVALTLSGGVDSSAIAVAVARATSAKVRAFTSHFPDHQSIDESGYAAIVANKFGLEHVLVRPEVLDLVREERQLTWHQEIMYGSFSLLVNWAIIREIRKQGIAVFLTGQGGDELFLGYERYFVPYALSRMRGSPASLARDMWAFARNSRLSAYESAAFILYFSNTSIRRRRYRGDAASVYSDQLLSAAKGEPYPLSRSLFDLQVQEVCGNQLRHLLRYDDRTAAAFGAEGRPAFLDRRLVEFALSLDWSLKIRDGWTKYIVRKYLDRAGLPEIAWRKQKLGFNAPTNQWTRELLAQSPGLGDVDRCRHILRPGLTLDNLSDRMLFPVYNLLSTSRAMGWSS